MILVILAALLLSGCSGTAQASQDLGMISETAVVSQAGSRPPVILHVSERQEIVNGYVFHYQDIYFADPDGDATAVTYDTLSSTLPYPLQFPDTTLDISTDAPWMVRLYIETTACWQRMDLVYESRIRDQAGNFSKPVLMSMSCTEAQALDTRPFLIAGLSSALPVAIILLSGFWLLFRRHPADRLPALRSMLLLFFVFLTSNFLHFIFHEGGHALYLLFQGVPVTFYVHPFLFSGFARPIINNSSLWDDILGSATAIPVAMSISLLFWKRRSPALLPLVMIFPFFALLDGFNLMGFMGDFQNVIQSIALPAFLFIIPGAVIICVGIVLLFSLLPLAGLDPGDNKALFVLPAALFMMSALSFMVAHLVVPGSPIDLEYFLGREILVGANSFIPMFILGLVLAVLDITLFRKLYPRLPAWLQTDTVQPGWKDLRIPAFLAAISVILGLVIIT